MKLNRRKLKKLIAEELKKLNEAPDLELMEEVKEILSGGLPEPYVARIAGDKIICYAPSGRGLEEEAVFEVIFK